MSGSTQSIAAKLQIKPGASVWLSDADQVGCLALIFADGAASLRAVLDAHRADLTRLAGLWVAYPKANRADINRDTLWPVLAEYGLRPISQVPMDEVWSALRFRPLKEGEAAFGGGQGRAS